MYEKNGFIKLYRKVLDNPVVCRDGDCFAVWCFLLLQAAHREQNVLFDGKKIVLQPGQLVTGRKVIARQFGISESKVQRVLKALEEEGQISQQTGSKKRLISILHWGDYQNTNFCSLQVENEKSAKSEQQNVSRNPRGSKAGGADIRKSEQQVNSKRTASEQQVNTYKKLKNIRIYNIPEEEDKEEEAPPAAAPSAATALDFLLGIYKKEIGRVTDKVRESFSRYLENADPSLVAYAIEEAALYNRRSLKYIEQILENHLGHGRKTRVEAERDKPAAPGRSSPARKNSKFCNFEQAPPDFNSVEQAALKKLLGKAGADE